MANLEQLLTYLTLISVPIGVFYHIMTLANTRQNQELTLKAQQQQLETRQAQLFMPLYSKFHDREFLKTIMPIVIEWEWTDYDDFQSKYGANNIEEYSRLYARALVGHIIL